MNQSKRKLKVLIVDDEPHIVTAIQFLINKEGFETSTAYNGASALSVVQSFRPDVVVLDVMMPGMSGFEVARQIRSNSDLGNTQIVFLTAKGTTKDKMQGYSTGGDFYMTKPFDNDELVSVVLELAQFG